MGQSIKEWTKYNLRETTFKKFSWSILEYFVPYDGKNSANYHCKTVEIIKTRDSIGLTWVKKYTTSSLKI